MQHASAHLCRVWRAQVRRACRLCGVLLAVTLLAAVAAGGAVADVAGPGGKTIDCYCTDKTGARVELGEMRCLSVDGRQFLAQCQMSLNVPMWREVQSNCLSASLGDLPGMSSTPKQVPQL